MKKGTKGSVNTILGAVFLLALVMLLVRPNSLAPSFIKNFSAAFNKMVKFATSG